MAPDFEWGSRFLNESKRQRRTGVTLLEVLVAIFVMALGMIALLTLFPLGVLRMAQAMQDDRTSQAGRQAQALAQMKEIRFDPSVIQAYRDAAGSYPNQVDPNGPSYPVLVDPVGWSVAAGLTSTQQWVGASSQTVRRVTLQGQSTQPYTNQLVYGLNWFSILDDITFDRTGVAPAGFERDIRYTWAFLCKKPVARDDAFVAEMSVVIFSKRPLTTGVGLDLNETAYNLASVPTGNSAMLGSTGTGIKAGDWVMDASYFTTPNPTNPAASYGTVQGSMHRIVGVDESGGATTLEVQPPFRASPANATFGQGKLIHMASVAEVMDLGVGRAP